MADQLRLYALKAVVTGAADGIGEAIARTLIKHGAQVLAVDSPESRIDLTFKRLKGITALAVDRGKKGDGSDALATAVRAHLGGLDILVNNMSSIAHTEKEKVESSDAVETWLERMAAATEPLLPLLKKSPGGRVINVGSLRSAFGPDGEQEYAASQQALAEFTAAQAAEYGAFGITANYIQPGAIMTPDSREIFEADKSFRDYCIARSAARRLGEPVDVAKVALFLASGDAVFVSGTGIVADGGRLAPG